MKMFHFTTQVMIDARSEADAIRVFDRMREVCIPSEHGVTLFGLRADKAKVTKREAKAGVMVRP